jgi:serine/threonine protein kinase
MCHLTHFHGSTAPEYVLDEVLITASDMYSLGCLIYAVHCKGSPPFRNHGNVGGLRDNAGRPVPDIGQLDADLQGSSTSLEIIIESLRHNSMQTSFDRSLLVVRIADRPPRHSLRIRSSPHYRYRR